MITEPKILIAGAGGVFGRRLAYELATGTTCILTLAGRRAGPLVRLAIALRRVALDTGSDRFLVRTMDLTDPSAIAVAAEGQAAVACTAGPFSRLSRHCPAAAVAVGAHWLDISDDREWVMELLGDTELHARAQAAGVAVAPGLSSTPAISGVLARRCKEMLPEAVEALVTLYIGNRNRKGVGSIARALASGTTESTRVDLPFGTRKAWRFDSPDAPLLRAELGLEAQFAVSFQATLGYRLMATFGRPALARAIAWLSAPLGLFGDPRGCLQVEAWDAARRRTAAWVIGRDQRMPVLPLEITLMGLLEDTWPKHRTGVIRPWGDARVEEWEAALRRRGLEWGEAKPAPLSSGA